MCVCVCVCVCVVCVCACVYSVFSALSLEISLFPDGRSTRIIFRFATISAIFLNHFDTAIFLSLCLLRAF